MSKLTGLDFVTAAYGTKRLGVGTHTINVAGLWINEDSTSFTSISAGDDDITTELGANGGAMFNKGAVITTARKEMTEIVIASGSVVAILSKV